MASFWKRTLAAIGLGAALATSPTASNAQETQQVVQVQSELSELRASLAEYVVFCRDHSLEGKWMTVSARHAKLLLGRIPETFTSSNLNSLDWASLHKTAEQLIKHIDKLKPKHKAFVDSTKPNSRIDKMQAADEYHRLESDFRKLGDIFLAQMESSQ